MAVREWLGPDVLVLGWIPLQVGGRLPRGWARRRGARLLFLSGNPEPPTEFATGAAGFDAWADFEHGGTREYRVAASLRGIRVVFRDDAPPEFHAAPQVLIGYTPMLRVPPLRRVHAAAGRHPRLRKLLRGLSSYDAGRSQPLQARLPDVDPSGDWIEYRHRAGIKLAPSGDLFCRYYTGKWAPFARVDLLYRVTRAGEITVRVRGTAVPSQRLYVDWRRPGNGLCEYDTRRARRQSVTDFLEDDGYECRPAPWVTQLWWRGRATAV